MSTAASRVFTDPRRPLPFVLLTLAAFLVARWLGIGLHEVAGHGLFAVLVGGSFYGVYVSPVTGFAMVHLPVGTAVAAEALVVLAGILVEILLGLFLFLLYPRVRTFVGRLFVLTLLEVLLVYAFAYLALGAFEGTGGDSARVVAVSGAPHLGWALFAVGIAWAIAAGYAISTEVLRLVAPTSSLSRQLAYVVLFWIVPLPVAAIPNAVRALLAPVSLISYVLVVLMIGACLVVAGWHLVRGPQDSAPMDRPSGPVAPMAVAALLVLPAWFAFGLSSDLAERALLGEPPLAAERDLASPAAINARVILTDAEDVVVEFRMKGVPNFRSPLERQAWATFEHRADFSFWTPSARLYATVMMSSTVWNATGAGIDTSGNVWFDEGERPNPRFVTLELARPEDERLFLNITQTANRTFLTLTVREPFLHLPVECRGCFLDELNLTWPAAGLAGSYVLVKVTAEGGNPDELLGIGFARYRSSQVEDAPTLWRLVLERV